MRTRPFQRVGSTAAFTLQYFNRDLVDYSNKVITTSMGFYADIVTHSKQNQSVRIIGGGVL